MKSFMGKTADPKPTGPRPTATSLLDTKITQPLPPAPKSILSPDARQSKNKSVVINEKANKINPLEERQREMDIRRLQIEQEEKAKHDPRISIR
jgi:hypothetical protein